MDIFRRKKKAHKEFTPPPPPPDVESTVDEARAQYDAVESRDEEIEDSRAKLLKIRRDNALGPRFWAAMGEGKRQ